jgi:Rrf2 family protein
MHFSAQEEYGLRCVLHLACKRDADSVTAREISECEQISLDYVHKLLGILKRKGLIKSIRGINGGFSLKRLPNEIPVSEVLGMLSSELNSDGHCAKFSRRKSHSCQGQEECKVKPFWDTVFRFYEDFGSRVTIQDLLDSKIPTVEVRF